MYLSRIDAQVKIRGYRIETGEIEFNLAKEDSIKQAVVIARADSNGVDKLVAYVILKDATESGQ
jgi:acyl-coenzyme A synthetase/AMP-(fatty) acid ligase